MFPYPKVSTRILWLMVVGSLAAMLGAQSVPAQAAPTTFSGQATVVDAWALGVDVTLVDTGFQQGASFAEHDHLLTAHVPGLLTAEALHAATIGQKKAARSEAALAVVGLTVGMNGITADVVMARAKAECQAGTAAVSGSSEIANLVINGTPITVTGQPNQTVSLPGGRVTLNEQSGSASGGTGTITVNALHVEVFGVADIVISHAHADVVCGDIGAGHDFVTGGGWITGTPSGARGNFGVAGGRKNSGALWGHLNYIDHGSNMHVKSIAVTAYEVIDATTRRITYTCENNGTVVVGACVVEVADNGEPGRNDTFAIVVPPAYDPEGSLQGGNIQLH